MINQKKLLRIALAFYTALLIISTHWPPQNLPKAPLLWFDKLVHWAIYSVSKALLGLTFLPFAFRRWLLAGLLLGAADEVTQAFFGRQPDWLDWLTDAAGISLGLLSAWLIARHWLQR